jgi:hypothetical protein
MSEANENIVGGLQISNNSQSEVTGGLAVVSPEGASTTAGLVSKETNAQEVNREEISMDNLLEMDSLPVSVLFGLSSDKKADIMAEARQLAILDDDNPLKQKAMTIRMIIENGEEEYLKSHPEATDVILNEGIDSK